MTENDVSRAGIPLDDEALDAVSAGGSDPGSEIASFMSDGGEGVWPSMPGPVVPGAGNS